MGRDNPRDIPRRKALLTATSMSSAFVGVATAGTVTAESENRETTANRVADSDLPPAARNNRPETVPAAKGNIPDHWMDDEGNFTIPESELEKDFGVEVYDGYTGKKLRSVGTNVVNVNNDNGLIDRYQDGIAPQGVRFDKTLWQASAGGVTMRFKGSFEVNKAAPEASVNLRLEANGLGFDVISLGITPADDRLFCIEPKAHPAIPLTIAVCPDLYWRYGSPKFDIGASGDACIGIDCPWTTCDICRGVSFNYTVDLRDL